MTLDRREFLQTTALGGLAAAVGAAPLAAATPPSRRSTVPAFDLDETTIDQLQDGLRRGAYSSRSLCEKYLARIEAIDRRGPALRAVIETNPDALTIAARLDAERKAGQVRGPLHGIPVVIKDNIATADRMQTTAGSLTLVGATAPRDAAVVRRLREAGAVIIGKTNLSEWANFRSSQSSSGWSGRGGQCLNPYALDRNPCGSSSGTGSAIAANLAAVGVGTETDGSVVCPSSAAALVGIKPTLGLVSRRGIVPIAHSQDTAGPMARTVRDAAILLGVLAGADTEDAITATGPGITDYTRFLDPNGLKGATIGVARTKLMGYHPATDLLVARALDVMRQQGATIVDPTGNPAWPIDLVNGDHCLGGSSTPAAVAGFAHVTVPAGDVFGLPVGLSFIGGPFSEPTLLKLAYAYEQATKLRRPPRFLPTAVVKAQPGAPPP